LDDTIGWTILAFIGGLAAQGRIVIGPVLFSILGTAAFLAFCFTIGRRWVARIIRWTGLTIGVLNQQLFTVIVLMAVVTTVCMPPLLRWALVRVPMRDEEKVHLEREAAEEKDFVPKFGARSRRT
jgi:Kef-type K+ transport system membrane component KefB